MGEIKCFPRYKLFTGILTTILPYPGRITEALEEKIGAIDYVSQLLDFDYTDYYTAEMGQGIKRFFVSFRDLVSPETLADIKIATNELEKEFMGPAGEGTQGRKVNFDPGILNASRIILATTKDNAHRIPLNKGIYGEVTLIYRDGDYSPLPWTYADYRSDEYRKILSVIRGRYKADSVKD